MLSLALSDGQSNSLYSGFGINIGGGICIARNVHNQIRAKLALPFAPMGQHRVKNIAEPIEVWREGNG